MVLNFARLTYSSIYITIPYLSDKNLFSLKILSYDIIVYLLLVVFIETNFLFLKFNRLFLSIAPIKSSKLSTFVSLICDIISSSFSILSVYAVVPGNICVITILFTRSSPSQSTYFFKLLLSFNKFLLISQNTIPLYILYLILSNDK